MSEIRSTSLTCAALGAAFVLVTGLGLPGTASALPAMSIGDVEEVEGNPPGTTAASFQVTLSSASASVVTASWATADGSATDPADYAAAGGVVTFNPGVVSQTVVVQVVRNLLVQPDRTFYVDLSGPSGAVLLKSRGVGTILDDDATNPGLAGLVVISDGGVLPTSGRNRLQWRNPVFSAAPNLRIRWNEPGAPCTVGDYPTNPDGPSDGLVTPDPALVGSHASQVYEHTGLTLDEDYCYTVWVADPGPPYSASSQAPGRPFDATGSVKWKYFTGATAIVAPSVGIDAVVAVSNDQNVHTMQRGAAGGPWPSLWSPVALGDVSQNRSPVITSGGVSRVFISTQDGRVQAIDVKTGAVLWSTLLTPATVQAAPAGIFAAFGAAWDYILVATNEDSEFNRFYALDPADGQIVDYYPKAGDDVVVELGPSQQMAAVDYATSRVYFGVLKPTTYTLLCLQLGPAPDALQLHWGLPDGDVDEPITSPVLRGGRVYVGSNSDDVYSVPDDGNPAGIYKKGVGDGGVKGFVWPDRRNNDLYVATNDKVHGLTDTGIDLVDKWNDVSVKDASMVLMWPGTDLLYVGSSDVLGTAGLFEIDVSLADPEPFMKSLVLEQTSLVVGAPSLDIGHDLVHLGSEAGTFYAVSVPLP